MNATKTTKIIELLSNKTERFFGVKPEEASTLQIYKALCLITRDMLAEKRVNFKKNLHRQEAKQVYYMSMEFLLGRSLKNNLHNLGIYDEAVSAIKKLGFDLTDLMECEPDAGLGNGGLGRLAAAYMDGLTSQNYVATGFSIKYEYGIFKQKIVDGWQTELPDEWLQAGDVWLVPRTEDTFEVKFGGNIYEDWQNDGLHIIHANHSSVLAVPYDMYISGYKTDAVNTLRLWSAKAPNDFDMAAFSRGDYVKAMENKTLAETISKVLYPADDHYEGKSLRLKQQYFFVSASIQSIIKNHLKYYPDLNNLGDKISIHINDTHPALCVPELMRILLDDYGYSWEGAWDIVRKVISYTNHTVMSEALERWPQGLFTSLLPRIAQIVNEINQRFCADLWNAFPSDWERVSKNAIVGDNEVRMANLCVVASHTVNGVSQLHSNILKQDIFADYYKMFPERFTNVTNGITHRRWVMQANPRLADFLKKYIGTSWIKKPNDLKKLLEFKGNTEVLDELAQIKRGNKERLAKYIKEHNGVEVSPDSIFDVQVKRLHEYKRQLLNALHILDLYLDIKENPDLDMVPRTFVFGAKAAPSYYVAKQIIRFIHALGEQINNDPDVKGRIKVVFIENYRVTLAEIIIPAADVSEQISIAGKEASGTGNMKFMINGAVTIGTMDGANVEIHKEVGKENIFIFGMDSDTVAKRRKGGYNPTVYYNTNPRIKRIIDFMKRGVGGHSFVELANSLLIGRVPDPYMVLADFDSYRETQKELERAYQDKERFMRMSLVNIAKAGFFAGDRSVEEYASDIWNLKPVKCAKEKKD